MSKKKKAGKKRAKHIPNAARSRAAKKGWRTRRASSKSTKRASAKRKGKPSRRNARGKPAEAILWRITVASPYSIRQKGKKKNRKGESPESAAYIVRAWYERKLDAIAERHALKEKAEEGRDLAVSENPRAFSKGYKADIEIKAVPYDVRLVGIVEETNEK